MGLSGTHGLQHIIVVANKRTAARDQKKRIIDLLSILAIIGAVICFS